MIPVLLSMLCVLAGVVTLLPDPFAEFLRDYGVIILAGLVLVGIVAGRLLAEIEIRQDHERSTGAAKGPTS